MRKTISVDKETPVCRFVAEKKHPNIQRKKEYSFTINPRKMEETLKTIREGKFPSKDLSRAFLVSPSKSIETWFETHFFDLDHPNENLESPKSRILKIRYIDKKGKDKPKEIFLEDYIASLGWMYCFDVYDKNDAEYLFPYVEKSFLDAEIRVFRAEYREANDNIWRPLDGKVGIEKKF